MRTAASRTPALIVCLCALVAIGASAGCRSRSSGTSQATLAITRVHVIDVDDGVVVRDRTVLIAGDRIESIQASADASIPSSATVVDGRDGYLMPGLWDMHVHITLLGGPGVLPLFVAHGVTGIRDAGSEDAIFQWREEVAAGDRIGPRIIAAGRMVDGPRDRPLSFMEELANTEQIREAVADRKARGAYVKLPGSFTRRDLWLQIADEAVAQGVVLAGHPPMQVPLIEAISRGLRSIEHTLGLPIALTPDEARFQRRIIEEGPDGRYRAMILSDTEVLGAGTIDDTRLTALAAAMRASGVVLVPTLTDSRSMATYGTGRWNQDARLALLPPETRDRWVSAANDSSNVETANVASLETLYRKVPPIVLALHRAGVTILAGTDAGAPFDFPGSDIHSELSHLVQVGFSPLEALQAATSKPARFLNLADSGTVAAGKMADLVLLERNPLDDIGHTERIAAVVLRGRYYDRRALDEIVARIRQEAGGGK